jgi:hypothetical protein
MISLSDPAARRGAIIAILALILWYYGGVEFQSSRYDETLMIAATMAIAHIFEDADMQRIVYFFMAIRVSIFMPFSSSSSSLSSFGIFIFVVALIFLGLYVSTFPSPQAAADGADASIGVAAFNGIATFVADGAAGEVSYESVDNYAGAPIEKESSSSPNSNTAEASKPLLGDSKEPAGGEGADSPRSEGYGSA